MNAINKLKELARAWDNAPRGTAAESNGAYKMFEAIMALPDDPPADHQDLVEMARAILKIDHLLFTDARILANAVIDRFVKKEPRKVEKWMVMNRDIVCGVYDTKTIADEKSKEWTVNHGGSYWIAKIIATEEV